MTVDDVFDRTGQAYLCMIHPVRRDEAYRQDIAPLVALSASVPDELVSKMIISGGWRERLLGVGIGAAKHPATFIEPMLESLHDPRGIAIVPTCASLAVCARRGIFEAQRLSNDAFDCSAFDGEIGWSLETARRFVEAGPQTVSGRGPNYGQVFEDHVELYEWISNGQPGV